MIDDGARRTISEGKGGSETKRRRKSIEIGPPSERGGWEEERERREEVKRGEPKARRVE